MDFQRDMRVVTIALCVFWCWCAGISLYIQFPTADTGQSHFDAVRLHVLDYLALALIPTVLIKEAVWALTRQQGRSNGGRHAIQPTAFGVKFTSLPEESEDVPFFLSPSVEHRSTVTQPNSDVRPYKVSDATEMRQRAYCRCRPHHRRMLTPEDHLVTFRDCIPERRLYRVAHNAWA